MSLDPLPLVPLPWARLEWREGRLHSPDYDDHYFGSQDPVAESREVFIEANDLPRRLARGGHLCIGETGFGTGLNLLLTLAEWRSRAPAGAFLSLFSLEAHPITPDALESIHRSLGLDGPDARALREQYPDPIPGLHRIVFPGRHAVLTLGLGDAMALLPQVRGQVDAWFLDGFAPRRNPGLWNSGVLRQIVRLSRPGTTFGTYTAAGRVRREFESLGFEIQRLPGHAGKRERLTGILRGSPPQAPLPPRRVAVVGAGISGLATASALADRGIEVCVFDPHGAGGGASGSPAAVLLPNPHPDDPSLNRLSLAGVRATHTLLERACERRPGVVLQKGVDFHGISVHARKRAERLLQAGRDRTARLFTSVPPSPSTGHPVLHYPAGLALDLAAFCQALADDLPGIRRETVRALDLSESGIRISTDQGELHVDAVVLAHAGGHGTPLCPEQRPVTLVAGQMTQIHAPFAEPPSAVQTGQGYCIRGPGAEDAWIGATYRRAHPDPESGHEPPLLEADDHYNLQQLAWVPGLDSADRIQIRSSWTGVRAVYRDRLPLVGASRLDSLGRVLLNLAHGSRGLLYAPLAGSLLADRLCNTIEALDHASAARLEPGRLG